MTTLEAVNTTLSPPERVRSGEEHTPTTPTPSAQYSVPLEATNQLAQDEAQPKTPTRADFSAFRGDKPSSVEPATPLRASDIQNDVPTSLKRASMHLSGDSDASLEKHDIDMGEGDDDAAEDDESDNDSVTSDSQRPSKKKKGQRFFCTEFPPCQLSFTRSEHLARHIRYVALLLEHDITIANVIQKAHGRTAIPVPLLTSLLEAR